MLHNEVRVPAAAFDSADRMTAIDAHTTAQPRTAAIATVWRELGLEASSFTNRDGGPLARTVKCLLDPLVIRPRLNPDLASPLLTPSAVVKLRDRMAAEVEHIEQAARWYEQLRLRRRQLGITSGNAQELYFPRAFELAVIHGAPARSADAICTEVLAEIHDDGGHRVDELLAELATEAARHRCLLALFDAWDQPSQQAETQLDWAAFGANLLTVLRTASGQDAAACEKGWAKLVDSVAPGALGAAIRQQADQLQQLWTTLGVPLSGRSALVSEQDPLGPPPYADTVQRPLPLDRSITRRAKAAVRRGAVASSLQELIEREVRRTAQPWGLALPDLQAAFVAGLAVAGFIQVLGENPVVGPPLAASIQSRVRKEAYVLHARRVWVDGQAMHPEQELVVAELINFWRPYLQRLWVRLHGRDVIEEPELGVAEMQDLLAGIARSVTLDHRQRIRDTLERLAG